MRISRFDTVLIYDDGTLYAPRLCWIVDQLGHRDKRILNGGLIAWINARGKIAKEHPRFSISACQCVGIRIPVGANVTWHYRSAIGHGTVIGVHKMGTTADNTMYSVRQHDRRARTLRMHRAPQRSGDQRPHPPSGDLTRLAALEKLDEIALIR